MIVTERTELIESNICTKRAVKDFGGWHLINIGVGEGEVCKAKEEVKY